MVSCYFNNFTLFRQINIALIYSLLHLYSLYYFFHSLTPENEKEQRNETNIAGDFLQSHPVNEFEIHHIRNSKN